MHTRVFQPKGVDKRRRRHLGRRRVGLVLLLVCAVYVLAVGLIVPGQALAGRVTSFVQNNQADTAVSLAWPGYGEAAVGAGGYGVLASHGSGKILPTASVAKTLTALAVLSKYPLASGQQGPTLTMTQRDVDFYNSYISRDGSVINVRIGQKLSERQAIEAMLLRSANNMADSLASWAFGSLGAYSTYANSYAASLGLSQTHVGPDASGFDPTTTSTASDLVRLGEAVMDNTTLAGIVGQHSAVIPEDGTIYNTNGLLGQQGIVGIKTGNNDQDPGVYLFAARYQPAGSRTIVIVGAIMGAPKLDQAKADALPLLATVKGGFSPRTPVQAGDIVGQYAVPWSSLTVNAVAVSNITLLGWRGTPTNLNVQLDSLNAPVSAGRLVGNISSTQSGTVSSLSGIKLAAAIPSSSFWWRLIHPLKTWHLHSKS